MVHDIYRKNDSIEPFSDAYDIANTAIVFLCQHISKVMAEGDACLIRSDDIHKLTYVKQGDAKDYQSITYVFTDSMFSKIIAPYPDIMDFKRSDANLGFSIEADLLKQIIDKSFSAQLLGRKKYQNASVVIITTLLLVLFQKNITSEQLYPEWLNDFINYLNSPYRFGVPISKLVTHTPYSYSRLTTLFKEYTGKSLLTYMNDLKLVYVDLEITLKNGQKTYKKSQKQAFLTLF